MEIGEEQDILMKQRKALQQICNKKGKTEQVAETIEALQTDLKLEKSARKSSDN